MTEPLTPDSPAPPPAEDVRAGPPWVRLLPWIIAGGLALLAAGLTVKNIRLRREHADLRTERDLAQTAYQMMSNQLDERTLLAERMITDFGRRLQRQEDLARLKVSQLVPVAGGPGEAQAIVVWDPGRNAGLLVTEQLAAPRAGAEYQVWLASAAAGDTPRPVTRFVPDADGRASVGFAAEPPVAGAIRFIVSVENKDSAPKTVGPIALQSR